MGGPVGCVLGDGLGLGDGEADGLDDVAGFGLAIRGGLGDPPGWPFDGDGPPSCGGMFCAITGGRAVPMPSWRLKSAAGEVTIAGVSRMAATTRTAATNRRRWRYVSGDGLAPVVCGERLNTIRAGVSGIPCESRLAAGALPHAMACQTSKVATASPKVRGPNSPTATAITAQAAATKDSGMVPKTALPKRDGVRTLGVRRNTPRCVTRALTQARATVLLSASITTAARGVSHQGASQAA